MAEENDPVMAEVMSLLEAEPTSSPAAAPGSDIPAHREQLAILVCNGKCTEAIGVNLTYEHVKRLDDKEVMNCCKRHEAYVGAKSADAMIDRILSLSTKALGFLVKIKDADALKNDLKKDYIISNEMATMYGWFSLKHGRLVALVNSVLIAADNVDFTADEQRHPSRDADGYPLAGVDEVSNDEQCPPTVQ